MSTPRTDSRAVTARWRFDGFDALDACHRETMRMLEQMSVLLRRLDETGDDDRARATAAEIGRHFSTTMREHHEDEERHVFPALAENGGAVTRHAVECLKQDHFWLDANWRELSPFMDAIAHGMSGIDIESLRHGVDVFGQLCHDHIALEETLIYPQASATMTETARGSMNREMASRRHRWQPYVAPH